MRATGTPEQDVDILADLFAEDLADWPEDLWLVFDDYQFAMEAKAPGAFHRLLLRTVADPPPPHEPEAPDVGHRPTAAVRGDLRARAE